MIDPKDWIWHGIAAHYCGSHNCRFHLATTIGDVVVSTVGAYYPPVSDGQEEIGLDRTYETMVFGTDRICDCGCGVAEIDVSVELDFAPYNDPKSAREGHMALCEKWAALDGRVPDVNR